MRASSTEFLKQLNRGLEQIDAEGLYKRERQILSGQGAEITIEGSDGPRKVLNFCANSYLGLADNADLVQAAHEGLNRYGLGMASVRFICGTEDQHRALEREIAAFLGFEDSILYAACFDANGGVFECLFEAEDAIISDALNHASLIDGIRLCKAKRFRYTNDDMADLETKLQEAADARRRVIVTDGVFSMDGTIAQLDRICDLADRYEALVLVDDCHGMGVLGVGGRGVLEHCGVLGRVDMVIGTLGKALGGSMGGFVAAKQPAIDMLRLRSRPYLFSNALAPTIVSAGRRVIQRVAEGRICVRRSGTTPSASVPAWMPRASDCCRDSTLSCRSWLATPPWRSGWPRRCWRKAFTPPVSPTPWCLRARPACAPRSRPHTVQSRSRAPSRPSSAPARRSASSRRSYRHACTRQGEGRDRSLDGRGIEAGNRRGSGADQDPPHRHLWH